MPANWLITSNDGTTVNAKNVETGTLFTGTIAEYNAMLNQTPIDIVSGAAGDYLRIR